MLSFRCSDAHTHKHHQPLLPAKRPDHNLWPTAVRIARCQANELDKMDNTGHAGMCGIAWEFAIIDLLEGKELT